VNILAGYVSSSSGAVFVDKVDVTGWAPHDLARHGVIRTFQRASIFPTLTTVENMLVGPLATSGESIRTAFRGPRRWAREESAVLPAVWDMIERFKLQHLANAPAGTLSGGQQRLVELGRALLMNPRVLVLDEPTAGVNPGNIDALLDELARLRGSGVTVILVEHNLAVVDRLCDTTVFMASGRPIASGAMATVLADKNVLAAAANY
jgi:ABC-type branched-subunit amino acid transport system ATPase component